MNRNHLPLLLIAVVLVAFERADAQLQRRWAIDGSVGVSHGVGGDTFVDRGGVSADAIVSLRWRAAPGHSAVTGISAAVLGPLVECLHASADEPDSLGNPPRISACATDSVTD